MKKSLPFQKKALLTISLLLASVLLVLLSTSGVDADEKDIESLWVITEASPSDGMNFQLQMVAERFEGNHDGIVINIDILPTNEEEREIRLKQLRTQIMSGNGPDVYLLPTTDSISTDSGTQYSQKRTLTQTKVTPLFYDVMQAIYNGVFADISKYYDTDSELKKDELNQNVMQSGVVNECRYVIPLRYDMPVVYSNPSICSTNGVSQDKIDSGILVLAQTALSRKDVMMSIALCMPNDTTLFPTIFDYKKGEILVSYQQIVDYLQLYQKQYSMTAVPSQQIIDSIKNTILQSAMAEGQNDYVIFLEELLASFSLSDLNSISNYINYNIHWSCYEFPLYVDALPGVLQQAAIDKVTGNRTRMQPLRAMDGSVVAYVTYFTAIGSSCKSPGLAYEFIREFLTEEYQWDIYRPRADRTKDTAFKLASDPQNDGLVEDSWPVRTKGSAEYLWDTIQYQLAYDYNSYRNGSKQLNAEFRSQNIVISDADIPILNSCIDEVRFPIALPQGESLSATLALLNEKDGTPTDADIDALAQSVYQSLWWHLAEG